MEIPITFLTAKGPPPVSVGGDCSSRRSKDGCEFAVLLDGDAVSLLGLPNSQYRNVSDWRISGRFEGLRKFGSYFCLSTMFILASSWANRLSYPSQHRELPASSPPRTDSSILCSLSSLLPESLKSRLLSGSLGICMIVKAECSLNMPVSRRDIESSFSYSQQLVSKSTIKHRY